MPTESNRTPADLSVAEYLRAFQQIDVEQKERELLLALYRSPNHCATATQLAELTELGSHHAVNLRFGRLGQRFAQHIGVALSTRKNTGSARWWSVFATGDDHETGFIWQMLPAVVSAIEALGWLTPSAPTEASMRRETLHPALSGPLTRVHRFLGETASLVKSIRPDWCLTMIAPGRRLRVFCGRLIVATLRDKYLWLALDSATFGSGEGMASWFWDEKGFRPSDAGEKAYPAYTRPPPSRNGYYDPTKDPTGYELERIQHAHLAYVRSVLDHGHRPLASSQSTPGLLDTVLSWATPKETEDPFIREVRESRVSSAESRRARLLVAARIPEARTATVTVYARNPDVVAEALLRAAGVCELCHAPAPFIRASDGTPYLEVHHRRRLADQGEDTLENAVACCPNCHRRAHFG